jgi:hypothetical protein
MNFNLSFMQHGQIQIERNLFQRIHFGVQVKTNPQGLINFFTQLAGRSKQDFVITALKKKAPKVSKVWLALWHEQDAPRLKRRA